MTKEFTLDFQEVGGNFSQKLVMMPLSQSDTESHDHRFFEFVYITGGNAEHTLNQNHARLSKGDYFIVDYGSRHRYENSRDLTLINCLFLPEMIDETLGGCRSLDELLHGCLLRYYRMSLGESWADRVFHDEDGRIRQLLDGMVEEYREKKLGSREILKCRLTEILVLTLRNEIGTDDEYSYSQPVQEVIRYLNANYQTAVRLKDFCGQQHYSLPYISRRFKQETGMTARTYLQKIRMEKSCELLNSSSLRIGEIARAVGYEDMKSFHEIFMRFLGMAPREYRKRMRAGREG